MKDLARRVAPTNADLRKRVAALEAEVQECRQLNLRLAELTDLVTDLLVPLARGDEAATREALARYKFDLAAVPPRYRSSYFSHIWGGGYAAGYYAYFGAEVLDHDAFQWFRENGGLTRENGQVFREKILSIGHSRDLAEAYRAFRGQDPIV